MIYIQTLENFRATRISMFFECRLVSKQFFWQQRWCDLAQSYPRVDTAATLITDRNCRCLLQNKVKIHFSLQFLCNCAFHILFWISFLFKNPLFDSFKATHSMICLWKPSFVSGNIGAFGGGNASDLLLFGEHLGISGVTRSGEYGRTI